MSDEILDIGLGGGDVLQKIVILIPAYRNVSVKFLTNVMGMIALHPEPVNFLVIESPYVDQAMRHAIQDLLKQREWERVVVVESDMICPENGLIKHALHTDDIVGSVYFQHAPPHQINCMFQEPNGSRFGHPSAPTVKTMLDKEALWKCAAVGLGFTSIARRVFEEWPDDVPTFLTGYQAEQREDEFTHGCISHDVHFCIEAGKLGRSIYLDTSIRCNHLTEAYTASRHYFAAHTDELKLGNDKLVHLPNKLILPYHAQKEYHVPRLAKSH